MILTPTCTLARRGSRRRAVRAFSVVELMLAVAIMGVIVFALYSVFNQTQKALRSAETLSGVSERGRAVMEMITREVEQAQPTYAAVRGANLRIIQEVNMLGGLEYPPKAQKLDKNDRTDIPPRTNYLHNVFFYNNRTNAWQGIGYRVIDVRNGVGVLQRFETNRFGAKPLSNTLSSAFINEPLTNASFRHVADGVIHFSVIPYDAQGYRLGYDTTNRPGRGYEVLRTESDLKPIGITSDTTDTNRANVLLQEAFPNGGDKEPQHQYWTRFAFKSNAMPAYLELELAVLEPDTLTQYYTMLEDQNPNATNFLARQINKVHLFRERVEIRTGGQ